MPYQPTLNFKTSSGTDLGNLGWITKEYLMSVYPQIANQLITPELWSWGQNYGQLGDNTSTNKSTPITTFAGGTNWKQVACGAFHTAAIKTDGTLSTWGLNGAGGLGINTRTDALTPVATFAGGTNWKQVTGGNGFTAAIKTDGTLWIWGASGYGQLGNNQNLNDSLTPITTFAGGTNWKQVSCGYQHVAAIKTDGTLWVWGRNNFRQLGDNTTTNKLTPVTTFAGGTNWKQVSASWYRNTYAIKTDGTLWCWGSNGSGQLGNNNITNTLTPVTTFAGGTNWKQVTGGYSSATAIKTDGTLWTWGSNYHGQLGDNTTTNRSIPVTTFAGGTNWKQVSGGYGQVLTTKTDGTLWTWGRNNFRQLGDNTTTNKLTPVTTFAGGTNWKQVACGIYFSAAIKTSDDLQGI